MKIPTPLVKVYTVLKQAGFEAFLVGGAVRDHLLGRTPKDFDLATNAKPEQVIDLFSKVVPTGINFGTVTIHIEGMEIEVTTYRCDGKYTDGRHPDNVVFADKIEDDLSRRDFTINALAFDIGSETIVDPFFGQKDLKNRIIRAVGDPNKRFSEDGLRTMRAIRFASQIDFKIEKETKKAICKSFHIFSQVSMERIRDEFIKILVSSHPDKGVKLLVDTGLMSHIIPAFMRTIDCIQNRHHTQDVFNHSISTMCSVPNDPVLRFSALLHDVGKPDSATPNKDRPGEFHFYEHEKLSALYVEGIAKRLKFSSSDVKDIKHLVLNHMRLAVPPKSDVGIRKMIKVFGVENVEKFLDLRAADIADSSNLESVSKDFANTVIWIRKILKEGSPLNIKDLTLTGRDIMEYLHVNSGPDVGKILSLLMERVLTDPSINTREKLLEIIDGQKI